MSKALTLTRTFDAPRELIFDVWTQREHLEQWFGPKGFKVISSKLDLRPGGTYHYGMQAANGTMMWGKWTFREITRPEKLVVEMSFSDEAGGVTRHPLSATWPLVTRSVTTFADVGGKTLMTLQWEAFNATEAEQQTFDASHESMKAGWGGIMEQLDAHLAKVKTP